MDVSGMESPVSKDMPDETREQKCSSEEVQVDVVTTLDSYFDDDDFYSPLPAHDDEMHLYHEKPVELPDDLEMKPATPLEDIVQDQEIISSNFPENDFDRGESPVAVEREDMNERGVNTNDEDISVELSNTGRSEETQGTEQREGTPRGVSEGPSGRRSSEKTEVNIKIVSTTETSSTGTPDTQTAARTNGSSAQLTKEQLQSVWALAKKLCKARCSYNENVCRQLEAVNQKLPPKKRKQAETLGTLCRRSRRLNTITNGGVSTIGKGFDSLYEDPIDWDWGQPLPKEICAEISKVTPSKPAPETPTITLVDDECPTSSSAYFEKSSPPRPKRVNPRSPISKSLEISISVTRFKNSSNTTIILSDSDEELPGVSIAQSISRRKTVPPTPELFDLTAQGGSFTMTHSAAPRQMSPTTRLAVRKRRRATENRAPSGPSFTNVDPNEVVVLGLSDESDDSDLEVMPVTKKPAPSESAQKPRKPKADDGETKEWCCPICLETKDKVANIMSTTCGHIFCGPCLQSTVKINKQCPNCRKKLTLRQIHNLYM